MDKVKSLTIALVVVIIAAIALIGVSYSRQKDAENKVAVLAATIQASTDLAKLKDDADSFVAYSGAAASASAAKWNGSCMEAQRGSDKGQCVSSIRDHNFEDSFWSNFIFW